eukprot:COSAG06_NODE_5502_length_3437_cov_4.436396_2_plen_83_part_00
MYQRFRKEAPTHLEVCEGSRAKFEIQPGHMREMARDFDLSNMDDLEDAVMYSRRLLEKALKTRKAHRNAHDFDAAFIRNTVA